MLRNNRQEGRGETEEKRERPLGLGLPSMTVSDFGKLRYDRFNFNVARPSRTFVVYSCARRPSQALSRVGRSA